MYKVYKICHNIWLEYLSVIMPEYFLIDYDVKFLMFFLQHVTLYLKSPNVLQQFSERTAMTKAPTNNVECCRVFFKQYVI